MPTATHVAIAAAQTGLLMCSLGGSAFINLKLLGEQGTGSPGENRIGTALFQVWVQINKMPNRPPRRTVITLRTLMASFIETRATG